MITAKFASLFMLVYLVNFAASAPSGEVWAARYMAFSADATPVVQEEGAEHDSENITWHRWLWWPLIMYVFWGMAHTCDEYFVRTIDVISERFSIPDDVAGATLMALGCNGPELSLNLIGVFHESSIGVGAVIGGEVFNVLVIIGTALLATPKCYMPLKLGKFTFGRDVFFYAFSVALLWYVLRDGYISRAETGLLFMGGFCYIGTVIMSDKLRMLLKSAPVRRVTEMGSALGRSRVSLKSVVRQITPQQMWLDSEGNDIDETSSSSSDDEDPEITTHWENGVKCLMPQQGSVMGVRLDTRNRMMDKNHYYDPRFMCLGEDSLLLSTARDPRSRHGGHCASGMVYDYRGTAHHHWHHGGLINEPVFLNSNKADSEKGLLGAPSLPPPVGGADSPGLCGKTGTPVNSAPFLDCPVFADLAVEVIPLEDILYVERGRDHKQFALHVQHHKADHSLLGGVVTLDIRSDVEYMADAWTEALMVKLINLRRTSAAPPEEKNAVGLVMQWVEWFQFPVKFWLHMSIPDMNKPDRQHLYPVSFTMSMVWLAVFAFTVIAACDGIHRDFGISNTLLGFTVAAAGTSFPNVFSGMMVARQGKTTMAVANALGANVQNVFLALAIPWAIKAFFITKGPFPMKVDDLDVPILWCYITLLPILIVYVTYSCTMPRWSGWFFLILYVIYLGCTVCHVGNA